jgi:hypothetical protein
MRGYPIYRVPGSGAATGEGGEGGNGNEGGVIGGEGTWGRSPWAITATPTTAAG